MKQFVCIGYDIPGLSENYNEITSNSSMLDGDIIVFCPHMYPYYEKDGQFEGKPKLTEHSSKEITKDSEHWKNEIIEALDAGKTIFVPLVSLEEYSIYSYKDYSGIGRSTSAMHYYSNYDNYQWMPFSTVNFIDVAGRKIKKSNSPLFSDYYKNYEKDLSYEIALKSEKAKPIFETTSGKRIVGARIKYKEGHLILIPFPKYNINRFTTTKGDEEVWTDAAITWGKKLSSCLVKIDKQLNSGVDESPPPDWVNTSSYELKAEKKFLGMLEKDRKKEEILQAKIIETKQNLAKEQQIKALLYGTGKQLEQAVTRALKLLDYQAEGYDDGILELDQIIYSPEGDRFIGECEGKDSSMIDITKFRQLSDAINEDFERNEVQIEAIGLLFGNACRLTEPKKRKDFFTAKCIAGAQRRKYGLIDTTDLFEISKYLLENNDEKFKRECRLAIKESLGGIIKFPNIPGTK